MKTIDLRRQPLTLDELLRIAKGDTVVVRSKEGGEFILEAADAFDREVAQLAHSKKFLTFLQEQFAEPGRIPIEDIESRLADVSPFMRNRGIRDIVEVERIGEVNAQKLKEAGIATTEALVKQGATPAGRKKIEKATGISHKVILHWTNHVDLYRIKGVQTHYADLLEAAGVGSVPELAQCDPNHLRPKLADVNAKNSLVRKLPSQKQVAEWVSQAKTMPRVVSY